mmetsp:Transcript_27525/g.72561  ORF Transcript_27525/g.72561 Transcript_27525/m.72561 type:complete len:108 (+) Transcript_27525:183-506(+)
MAGRSTCCSLCGKGEESSDENERCEVDPHPDVPRREGQLFFKLFGLSYIHYSMIAPTPARQIAIDERCEADRHPNAPPSLVAPRKMTVIDSSSECIYSAILLSEIAC